MRRKGQLLSIDALLSLVIVVMVVGVVMNTNDMIKAEITGLLDWYDRANIANNMLDVLTKNPGYPENWEENVSNVKVVGLRDADYPFALDYEKIEALNTSINGAFIQNSYLLKLSRAHDFEIEVYITKRDVNASGRFPKGEENIVFEANPGVNLDINGSSPSGIFQVEWIEITKNNGSVYRNEQICTSLKSGNNVDLENNDVLEFKVSEDITITGIRGEVIGPYLIPAGSIVTINVLITQSQGFQINYGGGSCPYLFKVAGQGNVKISVDYVDYGNWNLTSRVTHFSNLTEPTYMFAVINGSLYTDESVINASKARSPWIQYERRDFVIKKEIYNKTIKVGTTKKVLVSGRLVENIPAHFYLELQVSGTGNATFVVVDDVQVRGLFIEKTSQDSALKAVLFWREDGQNITKFYTGNTTSVKILWGDLFEELPSEYMSKIVELWIYENNFSDLILEDKGDLGLLLDPIFEQGRIKLWVWDDR
ncbi:hypothetical protein K1720_03260 [Thermococcus argininiproducens]|uniref:Uncharacterized protein n=1 Tax=Thermococcus argininiproducens TaxID=2866384 RepID=A0A9E7SD62_9EURY|nr:hypothetical protein [Thermococcus argininiproducens]USH00491.1 hypothetical protein K1720_03260 [Thermococcus argininiproducens]